MEVDLRKACRRYRQSRHAELQLLQYQPDSPEPQSRRELADRVRSLSHSLTLSLSLTHSLARSLPAALHCTMHSASEGSCQ